IFLVDGKSGPVPLDEEVAKRLRGIDKPVLLIANKCDNANLVEQLGEFYKFCFGDVHSVSAKQNRGRKHLLKLIAQHFPDDGVKSEPLRADEMLKLAVVGKRNTGKSTFINCLAEEERTIVSEVEGTTRDS